VLTADDDGRCCTWGISIALPSIAIEQCWASQKSAVQLFLGKPTLRIQGRGTAVDCVPLPTVEKDFHDSRLGTRVGVTNRCTRTAAEPAQNRLLRDDLYWHGEVQSPLIQAWNQQYSSNVTAGVVCRIMSDAGNEEG